MSENEEIEPTFSLASHAPIPVLKQNPVIIEEQPIAASEIPPIATKKPSTRPKTTVVKKTKSRVVAKKSTVVNDASNDFGIKRMDIGLPPLPPSKNEISAETIQPTRVRFPITIEPDIIIKQATLPNIDRDALNRNYNYDEKMPPTKYLEKKRPVSENGIESLMKELNLNNLPQQRQQTQAPTTNNFDWVSIGLLTAGAIAISLMGRSNNSKIDNKPRDDDLSFG